MATEQIHELTAAYALDALDAAESSEYEEHLRHCERCRDDLVRLQETASSLAYAVPAGAPPPALRERILEQARAERSNVVALRPRFRSVPAAAAVAFAMAAAAAVILWVWSAKLNDRLDEERSAHASDLRALALYADKNSRIVDLEGAEATMAVGPTGRTVLVASALPVPKPGKTYEAWVIRGKTPRRAGIFSSSGQQVVVPLTRRVPEGAIVAITIEREGGVKRPTTKPIITSNPV